jgi:hypothetical protein
MRPERELMLNLSAASKEHHDDGSLFAFLLVMRHRSSRRSTIGNTAGQRMIHRISSAPGLCSGSVSQLVGRLNAQLQNMKSTIPIRRYPHI